MKTTWLLLITLCTFTFLIGCDTADPNQPDTPDGPDTGIAATQAAGKHQSGASALTVAYRSKQTGAIVILEDRLRKTFPDGGPIRDFRVEKLIDGYNLIRVGNEADGTCRTEAFPLVHSEYTLNLALDELARRLYCRSTTCETSGGVKGECQPSFSKQSCPCSRGGDCGIGLLQADDLAILVFE